MAGKRLASILLTVVVAGCATQPQVELPPLGNWESRQEILAGLDNWGFSGRIAVRDGDDGFQGGLHWEQRRDYFSARVSGPLGMGTVRIAGDADAISVTDKEGEEIRLQAPEADLKDRYGWQIPIESLRYWALGIPDPANAESLSFGDDGRLAALEQAGWRVLIDSYRPAGDELMPRRIKARRGSAHVTVVIDRWMFR